MDTPLIHQQIAGNYADRDAMMAGRHARVPMGFMGNVWDVANAASSLPLMRHATSPAWFCPWMAG